VWVNHVGSAGTRDTRLIKDLLMALTADFGKGFSYANLYNCRQFYLSIPDQAILSTL